MPGVTGSGWVCYAAPGDGVGMLRGARCDGLDMLRRAGVGMLRGARCDGVGILCSAPCDGVGMASRCPIWLRGAWCDMAVTVRGAR